MYVAVYFPSLQTCAYLQGRCIVLQKVHWQLLIATDRFPVEDETIECVFSSSTIIIFLKSYIAV